MPGTGSCTCFSGRLACRQKNPVSRAQGSPPQKGRKPYFECGLEHHASHVPESLGYKNSRLPLIALLWRLRFCTGEMPVLTTPRASSSTPSSRTEARLKEAIKALQDAIRKSSRGYLKAVKVPSLDNVDSLELKAGELAASIVSLLQGREGYKNNPDRAQRIGEVAENWLMVSFPFAKVLLTIGKSAVCPFKAITDCGDTNEFLQPSVRRYAVARPGNFFRFAYGLKAGRSRMMR